MSEWLDLMLDEVARKQREAREAKEEEEKRRKKDSEPKNRKPADQSK